jgi:nucleoside-triphosphatase THEP1
MGSEQTVQRRKNWTISNEFPNLWEKKFIDQSISKVIKIRNIFESKDNLLIDEYYTIHIEDEKFAQLIKLQSKCGHRVQFYHHVKYELAKKIKENKKIAKFFDEENFENYLMILLANLKFFVKN